MRQFFVFVSFPVLVHLNYLINILIPDSWQSCLVVLGLDIVFISNYVNISCKSCITCICIVCMFCGSKTSKPQPARCPLPSLTFLPATFTSIMPTWLARLGTDNHHNHYQLKSVWKSFCSNQCCQVYFLFFMLFIVIL